MDEVQSVQNSLAAAGQTVNLKMLQKAFFVPEEILRKPSEFRYQDPIALLVKSPFPKKEKKKKKKKK
jgi:hypothetical protein